MAKYETLDQLTSAAQQIRNAQGAGDNTAEKVGKWMESVPEIVKSELKKKPDTQNVVLNGENGQDIYIQTGTEDSYTMSIESSIGLDIDCIHGSTNIAADQDITLSPRKGNIVLQPGSGKVYYGSKTAKNEVAKISDLDNQTSSLTSHAKDKRTHFQESYDASVINLDTLTETATYRLHDVDYSHAERFLHVFGGGADSITQVIYDYATMTISTRTANHDGTNWTTWKSFPMVLDYSLSSLSKGDVLYNDGNKWMNRSFADMLFDSGLITPLKKHIISLKNKGLSFDESFLTKSYNNLNSFVRNNAKTILFPIAGELSVVYGMDGQTGDAVPFSFARASSATMYNNELNMQLIGTNNPRLDFGYYGNEAKILIEKESANLIKYTDVDQDVIENWSTWNNNGVIAQHIKEYLVYLTTNGVTSNGLVSSKGIPLISGKNYTLSFDILSNMGVNNMNYFYILSGMQGNASLAPLALNQDFVNFKKVSRLITPTVNYNDASILFGINSTQTDYNYKMKFIQLEPGEEITSYIPTTASAVTRSADLLTYNLANNCSVYMKTTKQEVILDKQAGTWNIHEDLNNEGIYQIIVFDRILTDEEKLKITQPNMEKTIEELIERLADVQASEGLSDYADSIIIQMQNPDDLYMLYAFYVAGTDNYMLKTNGYTQTGQLPATAAYMPALLRKENDIYALYSNGITRFDIRNDFAWGTILQGMIVKSPTLEILSLNRLQANSVDLRETPNIRYLYAINSQISTLHIPTLTNLLSINVTNSKLETINISNSTKCANVNFSGNPLASIFLSSTAPYEQINVSGTSLTKDIIINSIGNVWASRVGLTTGKLTISSATYNEMSASEKNIFINKNINLIAE